MRTRFIGSKAQVLGSVAVMALLSACASKPQLSAQQESSRYLSRANRTYTPPGSASDPWGPYVKEAAAKFDVPDRWIREVMRQESGGRLYGRNGDLVTSSAGAMGLMQVMPATYAELRARYPELGDDAFDPRNNILAGTAYIREMYDIYGSPGFLAAYNAGPGRLDDHLTRNRSLPQETRRYVASVGPKIAGYAPNNRSAGEQYAMNALPIRIPEGPRYPTAQFRNPDPSPAVAITLDPVPYAPAQPVQLAQAPATPIRLSPQPEAVQLAELSDQLSDRIRLVPLAEAVELPEPPAATRPRQFAAFAPVVPPRAQPARAQAMAALTPPSPARRPGFALVSSANAAPAVAQRGGSTVGKWAVQVGAFNNPGLASSATTAARGQARDALAGARPLVASVRQGSGTLYRARLTGLSRDAAAQACEKLVRARTNCMLVSPDAQS